MTSSAKSSKTVSELLFEKYLRKNGHLDFDFEPTVEDKRKHPDYRLRWRSQELFFEVKERQATEYSPAPDQFNPYRGLRDKINEARRKFGEFKDYCCNVVISNQGDSKTLLDAKHVFGAMLGDLGFTFPILDNDDRHSLDAIQEVFLPEEGKMVRYKTSEYQNTTIAAVIGLEEARVRNREFESVKFQAIQGEQRKHGRKLSPKECAVLGWRVAMEFVEAGRGSIYSRVPRVIVCENPGARLPLPRDVLCGPFDERWAIIDQRLSPVYAGVQVRDIEAPEPPEELCLPCH